MQISIQEDFGGIGMGYHRVDLIKRLDHVLGQLNRPQDPSDRWDWWVGDEIDIDIESCTQLAKEQYEELRKLLRKVDEKAVNILSRTLPCSMCFSLLTPTNIYRISLNLCVCSASPMPIILHLGGLALLLQLTTFSVHCHYCLLPHSPLCLGLHVCPLS